jgi:hypothetical protein
VVVICTEETCALTVMLRFAVAVSAGELESFTCTVKDAVPDCVGVPEMIPVAAARTSPVGSCPDVTLHV